MAKSDYSFLEIDQNALDREWVRQPTLYFKYALKLAEAKKSVQESAAALDLARAEVSRNIRAVPQDFGLEKVTEKAVEAAILEADAYLVAQEDLNHAKHEVDVLVAVVNALEHKKRSLEGLVSLHGQNYFSSPRADGAGDTGLALHGHCSYLDTRRTNHRFKAINTANATPTCINTVPTFASPSGSSQSQSVFRPS